MIEHSLNGNVDRLDVWHERVVNMYLILLLAGVLRSSKELGKRAAETS